MFDEFNPNARRGPFPNRDGGAGLPARKASEEGEVKR